MPERNAGSLIIVTGASGVGKDAVCGQLLTDFHPRLERIVTYASRPPRPGEVDGVDYHFVTPDHFSTLIEQGEFAEYTKYGSTYKGTHRNSFRGVIYDGNNYLWRIDPERAATFDTFLKNSFPPDEAQALRSQTMRLYVGSRLTTVYDRAKARAGADFDREEFRERVRQDWSVWQKHGTIFEEGNEILMNTGPLERTVAEAKNRILTRFPHLAP